MRFAATTLVCLVGACTFPEKRPGDDDGGVDAAADDAASGDGAPGDGAPGDGGTDVDAAVDAAIDSGIPPAGMCVDPQTTQQRAIVEPAVGQVTINEWMPDPAAVADAVGEWFELRATAAFDLNGLQLGTTALGMTTITSSECIEVAAGGFVLLARTPDTVMSTLPVAPQAIFTFSLPNSNGTLQIGNSSGLLDDVTWTATTSGRAIMIDPNTAQCPVPGGISYNGGTDSGTPGAANPNCP